MDARTSVPQPINEPVLQYQPGSPGREALLKQLAALQGGSIDLPSTIGGESRLGSGEPMDVVQPHAHAKVLGTMHNATADDAKAAVAAAKDAAPSWRALPSDDRAPRAPHAA